jgi:haloalkane dehalogenase
VRQPSDVVEEWRARGSAFTAAGVRSMVWSEGMGEPVVCLHGVPASAFTYRRLLPELASRGLRGIAFDLPGLGLAERPDPGHFDYSWSGLAAWCLEALDALHLDRAHLVLHDIGGPIGFDLARRSPSRISSVTVLNSMIRVSQFRRPLAMAPFARRRLGRLVLAAMRPWAFELILRRMGMASGTASEEVRAYLTLLRRDDGGRAFLAIMRSFERTGAFESRIVTHLRASPYPVQVIWGEDDPALRVERQGEEMLEALRVETIHRVPGRHFVAEDSPAAIAELVARQAAGAAV